MNAGRPYLSGGCTEGLPEDATLERDPSEQKGQACGTWGRAGRGGQGQGKGWEVGRNSECLRSRRKRQLCLSQSALLWFYVPIPSPDF